MKAFDRIREKELIRTNTLGAETRFRVGAIEKIDGHHYRITRQRRFHAIPDSTWVIYGVPA